MSSNEVNVNQARDILKKLLNTEIVPFLWGAPGIGKSSIVKQLAKELDYDIIDLRLSLLNPVDLRGLPIIDKKKHLAEWLKPAFLPTDDNKKPGILFLDEINLAHQSVQAAAYQLILDKKLGEYSFPKHWKIIAAGNREVDKANVYKISAPLANRFIHLTVFEDWRIWKKWAENNNVNSLVTDFIALHSALFLKMPEGTEKAFPSPRSWHFVSDAINAFEYKKGEPDELLKSVIEGTVGKAAGQQLIAYLTTYDSANIKEKIKTFYNTGKIDLPEEMALRFAIIKAVYQDYQNRDINNSTYLKFLAYLSPEEKKLVQNLEKQKKNQTDAFGTS